jgi:plastocyanin domain-containing protein
MKLSAILMACSLALAAGCAKEEKKAPAPADKAADKPAQVTPVEGEIKGRRVDITVTKSGYSPDNVEVKANEEVTLVFTMPEHSGCGEEIAIPSQNILKKLEVGKPLAIPFKAEQPGEVKFACGMDMMRGKIIVTAAN